MTLLAAVPIGGAGGATLTTLFVIFASVSVVIVFPDPEPAPANATPLPDPPLKLPATPIVIATTVALLRSR